MVFNEARATNLVLRWLPPFCFFSIEKRSNFTLKFSLLSTHFALLGCLYTIVSAVATIEGSLYIPNGIGILQNPPFLGHLVSALVTVPLLLLTIRGIDSLRKHAEGKHVYISFLKRLRKSVLSRVLFKIAILGWIAAVAANIVLTLSYEIEIYDSLSYPLTMIVYSIVRAYVYFLYALVAVSIHATIILLFASLHSAAVKYHPFHIDKMGGLKIYFKAIDRPVYAIQTIAVIVVVTNYIGWGELSTVPVILAVLAPTLIFVFAIALYYSFHNVLKEKKLVELKKLAEKKSQLYQDFMSSTQRQGNLASSVDEIAAAEKLEALMLKNSDYSWLKYLLNLVPVVLTHVDKLYDGKALEFFNKLLENI